MKNKIEERRIRAISGTTTDIRGPLGIWNRQEKYKGKRLFAIFLDGMFYTAKTDLKRAKDEAGELLKKYLISSVDIVLFEVK